MGNKNKERPRVLRLGCLYLKQIHANVYNNNENIISDIINIVFGVNIKENDYNTTLYINLYRVEQ